MANIFSSDFWITNPNKRRAQRVYDSQERDINTPNMFFQNLSKYGTPNTMLGNIASGIPQPTDNPMLSLGQNSDIGSLLQSFNPTEYAGSQVERSFGLDAQKEAETRNNTEVQSPIIKADTSNPDDFHNDFMRKQLEQAANNAMNFQSNQSQNAAIDYTNRIEAGIARGQNSRQKGSYTGNYQRAVAYTPQAMNFGSKNFGSNQQQSTNVSFGNTPNNSTLGRVGNINGLNMYDANRQLKSFNKQEIADAGKAMEGKFIGTDNQLHDKSVMGGFTTKNENYPALTNLSNRDAYLQNVANQNYLKTEAARSKQNINAMQKFMDNRYQGSYDPVQYRSMGF